MRLRHIEIFFHVYQEGSISGAARALHVSQPSVSKTLRHAEDQFGFPLFDRIKGRLHPTPQADELFAEVRDIYSRMSAFDRTAKNIRGRSGGHIRLGVLPSLGFSVVPRFIAEMRQSNRELSFDIDTLHTDEMATALLERRYDICLGFGAQADERITQLHISDVALVLLAQPGAFSAGQKTVDLKVLEGQPFIGLEDSGPAAELASQRLAEACVEPATVVTAHTHYVAASLVKLGVGLAIIDEFTAQSTSSNDLEILHFSEEMLLPFTAMHLTNSRHQALADECIAALHKLFS